MAVKSVKETQSKPWQGVIVLSIKGCCLVKPSMNVETKWCLACRLRVSVLFIAHAVMHGQGHCHLKQSSRTHLLEHTASESRR